MRWSIRALRCLSSLPLLTSPSLIGQGATHCAQRGRIFDGPVREVEIERAHLQQIVFVILSGRSCFVLSSRRVDGGACDRSQVVLPCAGDVRRQVQGVDTGGECLDAAPEQPGKSSGTRVEAGVVPARVDARADSR